MVKDLEVHPYSAAVVVKILRWHSGVGRFEARLYSWFVDSS